MFFLVYSSLLSTIANCVKYGNGIYRFGKSKITLFYEGMSTDIEPEECLLVERQRMVKCFYSDSDVPIGTTKTEETPVEIWNAVEICQRTLSILKTVLWERQVTFDSLEIHLHNAMCNTDGASQITWGYAENKDYNLKSMAIHLFLKSHKSDVHFLGTLIHELSHALHFNGHDAAWLTTMQQLSSIVVAYLDDIHLLDCNRHSICAAALGPNMCSKLDNVTIKID